jgi:hypothetical protein
LLVLLDKRQGDGHYLDKLLFIKYSVVTILHDENLKAELSRILDYASVQRMLREKKSTVDTYTRIQELKRLLAEYNTMNSVERILKIFRLLEVKDTVIRRFEFIYSLSNDFKCPPLNVDYLKQYDISFDSKDFQRSMNNTLTNYNSIGIDVPLPTLIFIGFDVDLTKVINEINNMNPAPTNKLIKIHAFNQIIITGDVVLENKCLSIISPIWKSNGNNIKLIGPNGVNWSKQFNKYPSSLDYSAPDTLPGENGNTNIAALNGKSGDHGSNGPSFQAFGNFYSGTLQVLSSGGNGGNGQNGQRGEDGQEGGKATWYYGINVILKSSKNAGRGGNGGTGGNGGSRGLGGHPGKGHIDTKLKNYITFSGNKGNDGIHGTPGKYGLGGKGGYQYTDKKSKKNIYADPGSIGASGQDAVEQKNPDDSEYVTLWTILSYEKSLISLLYRNDASRHIALDILLNIVKGDHSAMFEVGSQLGLAGIIEELILIHECYWKYLFDNDQNPILLEKIDLIDLYESFMTKLVKNFVLPVGEDPNTLISIYTSAYAAYSSLRSTYSIINLNYLDYYQNNSVKDYQTILRDNKKIEAKNKYSEPIIKDIETANNLIKKLSELGLTYITEFDTQFKRLFAKLKSVNEENKKEVEKLRRQSYFSIVSEILGFGTKMISCFGPKGKMIGALGEAVQGGLTSNTDADVKLNELGNPIEYVEYDFDDENLLKPNINKSPAIDLIFDCKLSKNNNKSIEDLKKEFEGDPIKFSEDHILVLTTQLEKNKRALNERFVQDGSRNFLDATYDVIQGKIPTKLLEVRDDLQKDMEKTKKALNAMGTVFEFGTTVKNIQLTLKKVKLYEEKSKLTVMKSKDLKNFVNTTFRKFLSTLSNVDSLSNASSRSVLDYLKFKVKKSVDDMIRYFRAYFKGFDYEGTDDILNLFTKYDQLSEAIESTCGRILDNGDQLRLSSLIVNTSLATVVKEAYLNRYNHMNMLTSAMTVIKEGNDIINISKQIFFPYTIDYNDLFLDKKIANPSIQTNQTTANIADASNTANNVQIQSILDITKVDDPLKKVQSVVSTVVAHVNILRKNFELTKSALQESRMYLFRSRFDSTTNEDSNLKSFFICREKQKLLDFAYGKLIEVQVDIYSEGIPQNIDAVKFTEISIRFKYVGDNAENETKFKTYRKSLESMSVEMTSSGYYDYKYNGVVYRFENTVVSPSSNYGKTSKNRNEYYQNISVSAPLFSPYTTWRIRLVPSNNNKQYDANGNLTANSNLIITAGISIEDIKNYELHFVGEGSYLKTTAFEDLGNLYNVVKISKAYEAYKLEPSIM